LKSIAPASTSQSPAAGPDRRRPVFRALADLLHDAGVRDAFGVMGEDTAGLTVGLMQRGIGYRGARHEAVAVGMADGYAWASGRIGVGLVTRGPGVMNAATACRTAVQGRRRVLLIAGDAPVAGDHAHDYKFIDQAPIAAALGLRYFTGATPAAALTALAGAFACAGAGAPALVTIPADVLAARVDGPVAPLEDPGPITIAGAPPTAGDVDRLVEIVDGSARPLILAGAGAASATAVAALRDLAQRTGALLGTTLLAKDLFRHHPRDVGIVGGFASDPAVQLLAQVDCVLAFGASLTPFTTAQRTLFRGAPIVQVDTDRAAIGAAHPVALGIVADAGAVARALAARLPAASPPSGHDASAVAALSGPLYAGPDESTVDELDPRIAAMALDRMLPADRAVVLDSGRFMTAPGRFMRVPGPDRFRLTADAGSIATGLGVALGAAVARPGPANVLFIGDGGLSMTAGDLETAARHGIPLIVVVMNDRAYGAERVHLAADALPVGYAALPEIDFAAVARSFGVAGVRVRTLAELERLGPELRERSAPLVIDCRIPAEITTARLRWA
jgi:acetolactate synthase-1/2/3 large subunit